MLPKFTVKQHGDRWFVETNWAIPNTALKFPGVTEILQVSTAGRLDTASAGWATETKARAAMEQCKRRLR